MKKSVLICIVLAAVSVWLHRLVETGKRLEPRDQSQVITSSTVGSSRPVPPLAQKATEVIPTLDEQIHSLRILSDDEIHLKIKETDEQFQKTGLIEKANKGSLTEKEERVLRSMLRTYHALQILRFMRAQS